MGRLIVKNSHNPHISGEGKSISGCLGEEAGELEGNVE